jgi:hypothetical protein
MPGPAAWTREILAEHLQGAVELELTTIPPYLTALYSLRPKTNEKAATLIRSVVVEEMLHLALASNVYNAIGGEPRITEEFAPRYPAKLPFHTPDSFAVALAPLSDEALDTFLAIENPNHPDTANVKAAPSEAIASRVYLLAQQYGYATIGEFYGAVEEGLRALDDGSLFTGKYARQITFEAYFGGEGTGHVVVVEDLESALEALREIVEQGEGDTQVAGPSDKYDGEGELAHFYRFQELKLGKEYRQGDEPGEPTGEPIAIDLGQVFPMRKGLKREDLTPAQLEEVDKFNDLYGGLLREIQSGINGEPKAIGPAVGKMSSLPEPMRRLMEMPLEGGGGETAGPMFEYRAAQA